MTWVMYHPSSGLKLFAESVQAVAA
jgi:hypothetical protein